VSAWDSLTQSILGTSMAAMGTPFTFIPKGGQPIEVRGVFDDAHVEGEVDAGGEVVTSTHAPIIGIKISEFSQEPKQRDKIKRKGINYDIIDTLPDGQGGLRLVLHVESQFC